MSKKCFFLHPGDKDLFKDVEFLVAANSNERHNLWEMYYYYLNLDKPPIKTWEQELAGESIQIGTIDKRPIVVATFCAKLNGHRIMFYYGCSQLVDHKMIDEWLQYWTLKTIRWDNNMRWAHCDAMNFHSCLDAIGVLKEYQLRINEKSK